jgi:CRISPR-associated endonuclease Cas2
MADFPSIDGSLSILNKDGEAEVVIAYDIDEDDRRREVRKVCEEKGQKVQRSVYEIAVTKPEYRKLTDRLENLIDEGEDSLCVYLLPQPTEETAQKWGLADPLVRFRKMVSELNQRERLELMKYLKEE